MTTTQPLLALDAPRELVLEHVSRLVLQAWRSFDRARPDAPTLDAEMLAHLARPLPRSGIGALAGLDEAAAVLEHSHVQARPRFFAWINGSGLEIGALGDLLAASHDVNLAGATLAAERVEQQALRWLAELVRYPAAGGTVTSGGTMANLTALAAARERALPGVRRRGLAGTRPTVYCSAEAHHSVVRAAEILGVGADQVRAIGLDDERALRVDLLEAALDADLARGLTPIAVVATAGTALTGAVDPIERIAAVSAPRGVWLHVDGAYGLPARAAPSAAHRFGGLERADSVSVDAHKWLYLPKACGCVLVRDADVLRTAFAHEADYLLHDGDGPFGGAWPVDQGIEYSRPFRALKLWLAFTVHGADAFAAAVERNLRQARLLTEAVAQDPTLELVAPTSLSIVCFRHRPAGLDEAALNAHNRRLADRMAEDGAVFVSPAVVDGRVCLRPCITNYRSSDEDVLEILAAVRRLSA